MKIAMINVAKELKEKDLKSKIEDNEVIEVDEFSVNVLKVKKNGQLRTTFTKFGEMEDVCRYFYDYNF